MQSLLQWKSNNLSITYTESVSCLSHPACNAHAPYSHPSPVRIYSSFPHYLIHGTIFGEKKLFNIKCVLIFSTILSETFLVLRRTERDMIIHVYWSSCKVLVILVRFHLKFNFLNRFSNNNQISYFMKISSVGGELFQANGRSDMTKLTVAFLNFPNGP